MGGGADASGDVAAVICFIFKEIAFAALFGAFE